jgi:hypothetical protein
LVRGYFSIEWRGFTESRGPILKTCFLPQLSASTINSTIQNPLS